MEELFGRPVAKTYHKHVRTIYAFLHQYSDIQLQEWISFYQEIVSGNTSTYVTRVNYSENALKTIMNTLPDDDSSQGKITRIILGIIDRYKTKGIKITPKFEQMMVAFGEPSYETHIINYESFISDVITQVFKMVEESDRTQKYVDEFNRRLSLLMLTASIVENVTVFSDFQLTIEQQSSINIIEEEEARKIKSAEAYATNVRQFARLVCYTEWLFVILENILGYSSTDDWRRVVNRKAELVDLESTDSGTVSSMNVTRANEYMDFYPLAGISHAYFRKADVTAYSWNMKLFSTMNFIIDVILTNADNSNAVLPDITREDRKELENTKSVIVRNRDTLLQVENQKIDLETLISSSIIVNTVLTIVKHRMGPDSASNVLDESVLSIIHNQNYTNESTSEIVPISSQLTDIEDQSFDKNASTRDIFNSQELEREMQEFLYTLEKQPSLPSSPIITTTINIPDTILVPITTPQDDPIIPVDDLNETQQDNSQFTIPTSPLPTDTEDEDVMKRKRESISSIVTEEDLHTDHEEIDTRIKQMSISPQKQSQEQETEEEQEETEEEKEPERVPGIAVVGNGVTVKKSNIPNAGNGLFADRAFSKGELITEFRGNLIDKKRADELRDSGKSQYIRALEIGYAYIDGYKDEKKAWGRAVDHSPMMLEILL
jgi:hypothetical protein